MRRIYIIILLALTAGTGTANAQKKLTILHTNDTHSCILPIKETVDDTLLAGRGGYLRRIAMLKEERAKTPDLLLFDSGDFSQGSAYYTLFKGDVEIGLMNQMGYTAATIGNHEFDYGLENMARLFKKANFPIVCANYDFTNTVLDGIVKPYIVIRHKGLKIGVFGLGPKMSGLISEKNINGIKYLDPIDATKKVVGQMRNKEKCDLVICLSHLGWKLFPDMDDNQLIAATSGIDLVLGGHSHTYMKEIEHVKDSTGKMVPDEQNGKHGIFIGKIEMELKTIKR